MDNQQIATKLVYDQFGLDFKMETFQDRLILQKTIYLVQNFGLDLGYHFSWYLKGPYSTSLASDGFSIQDELTAECDESKNWKLDDGISKQIGRINNWFKETDKEKLAKNLELLASVHFLITRKEADTGSPEKLSEMLRGFGKDFSIEDTKWAVEELSQHGAFN